MASGVCRAGSGKIKKTLKYTGTFGYVGAIVFGFKVKENSLIEVTSWQASNSRKSETTLAVFVNSTTKSRVFAGGTDGYTYYRDYYINSGGYLACDAGSGADAYTSTCMPKYIYTITA